MVVNIHHALTAVKGTAVKGTAVQGTAVQGTAVQGTALQGRTGFTHPTVYEGIYVI